MIDLSGSMLAKDLKPKPNGSLERRLQVCRNRPMIE
jgi:hypothetical protein